MLQDRGVCKLATAQSLTSRPCISLPFFALIYIGTEVTLGGWCIRAQDLRLVLTWLYQDGLLRL